MTNQELTRLLGERTSPRAPSPQIAASIGQGLKAPELVYLSRNSTFHFPKNEFFILLFDTPAAVLFSVKCHYLSTDDQFHYFSDERFNREWSFSIHPAGNFAGHSIWSRARGTQDWQLWDGDAIMASPSRD